VEWESRVADWAVDGMNCLKADPSLKSFLFTLKNPHNFQAKRFSLKAEKKDEANFCASLWGPCFARGDIRVSPNTTSHTSHFGNSYANDTGLDGKTFFTRSGSFSVKEIEVFEITN
jgi:hypothetical protein